MKYSHTYRDPATGNLVDVLLDDGTTEEEVETEEEYRNASRPPTSGSLPGTPRPRQPNRPVLRPRPRRPVPVQAEPVTQSSAHVVIEKQALAEMVPAVGQLWASFLGRPEKPDAIGNDIIDRNNAAMHRDALAMHQQNQTRILALTDLASRVIKLFG